MLMFSDTTKINIIISDSLLPFCPSAQECNRWATPGYFKVLKFCFKYGHGYVSNFGNSMQHICKMFIWRLPSPGRIV